MIVVDATVRIDYLNGVVTAQTDWLDQNLPNQRVALTDITLCEVLQGVRGRSEAARVKQYLMAFVAEPAPGPVSPKGAKACSLAASAPGYPVPQPLQP